jgi:hypothetical protein
MNFFRVYKLKRKELENPLIQLFSQKMEKGEYDAANFIAVTFKLPHEKLKPTVQKIIELNKSLGYIKQADDLKRQYILQDRGILTRVLTKLT